MPDFIEGRAHEFGASRAPTTADDADDGWDAGSFWLDRSSKTLYLCVDPAYGAADWDQVAKLTDVEDIGTVSAVAGTTASTTGSPSNTFYEFDNAGACTLTFDQGTAGAVVFATNHQSTVAAAAGSGVTLSGDGTTATTGGDKKLEAHYLSATEVFISIL